MFCENCGAQLQQKKNKLVCPNCGKKYQLEGNEIEKDEYIKPRGMSSKKNIIIVIIAAVLVLGLGAGITAIAVTNSPSYKISHGLEIAEHYLLEHDYEQAIIEYEKVLKIDPMNVDAYLGLAKAYEKSGDIDSAIEVLREGLDKTGDKRIEKRLNKLLNQDNGILSGKVCKASDPSTPVSEARVEVYKNGDLLMTQNSDRDGNYSISEIPEGRYYIEITSDGYIDFCSYANVKKGENTYMETFLLIEGSENETGVASGEVYNSFYGSGVDNATLTVKKDWNNTDEFAETVATTTTDSYGRYTLELPLGNYTIVASKDGYVQSSFNIIVQPGTTYNQNGTIFPEVSEDVYLITLTWGEYPEDLDSHVEGTLFDGTHFHVYFEHTVQYDGEDVLCDLDYDDTSSYGPEHITLKASTDKTYYYYIFRYAGRGTVANSGAKITVHKGNELIAEFNVPTDLGDEDYWNVFAIKDGRLITKNTITSSADTNYAD